MAPAVLCLRRDDTVQRVADFFLQLRLESAPVVDDEGLLVGIVSVTELMMLTASGCGWHRRVGEAEVDGQIVRPLGRQHDHHGAGAAVELK